MIKKNELPVKIKTSENFDAVWNLLSSENLRKVGVDPQNVQKIETFFKVPGILYTEPGVASETHKTGGSIGTWIYTALGLASIQDIIYYDENINQDHYYGKPHWNHERRFINIKGKEKRESKGIEYHIIDDSDILTVSFEGKKRIIRREKKNKRLGFLFY